MAKNPKNGQDTGQDSGPADATEKAVVAVAAAEVATGASSSEPLPKDDVALVPLPGTAPVAHSLGEAAAALGAPVVPVPAGGPGVGAAQVAEPVEGVRTLPIGPTYADLDRPADQVARTAREPLAGSTAGNLVGSDAARTLVDPNDIPGTRELPALTTIDRNGRIYQPGGEPVPLDFASYSELVSIGAVPPIDWETGELKRF